jgi:hypothetical protein
MSDIRIEIDVTELVDDLNLNEQRKLVEYLKDQMGDNFDTSIPEGEYVPRSLDSATWIDFVDIIHLESSYDKERMYEEFKGEFEDDQPNTPEALFSSGTTYNEQTFGKALNQLWESRNLLNTNQIARIVAITKESYV